MLLPEGAISGTPALLHNPPPKLRAGAYNWIRLQNTARGHFMEDWNRRKGGEGTKDAFFLLRRDFFFHFADVCCPDAPFFHSAIHFINGPAIQKTRKRRVKDLCFFLSFALALEGGSRNKIFAKIPLLREPCRFRVITHAMTLSPSLPI